MLFQIPDISFMRCVGIPPNMQRLKIHVTCILTLTLTCTGYQLRQAETKGGKTEVKLKHEQV